MIEALYQGRYKAISVEQILSIWRRRGKILSHFNREFEAIVTVPLPDRVQAQLRALAREHQLEHRQQYQNQNQNQNQNQTQTQTQRQNQRPDQPQPIQPAQTYQNPQAQNPQLPNPQLPNPQLPNPQARTPQAQNLHPYPEPSLDLSPSAQPDSPESETILKNAALPKPIVASLGANPVESKVWGEEESLESNSLGENSLESEDTPGGDRLPLDSLPSSSLGDAVSGDRAPTLTMETETIEEEATPPNAPLPGMAKFPSLPKLSQLAKILNFNPANTAIVEVENKTRLDPETPLETSSNPIPNGIPDATSALTPEPTIAETLETSGEPLREPVEEPKLPALLLMEPGWSPAVRRSSSQIDQFCPTPDRSGFDRKLLALANQS